MRATNQPIKHLTCGLCALAIFGLGHTVSAEPIAVDNPSFEADVLGEGGISPTIMDWNTSLGGGDGAFNPTGAQYPPGAIPDGQNVAYANSPGNHVDQALSASLQANSTYTLEVEIGNRLDDPFAGYIVQLQAGGVVLAEDNSSQTPGTGEFVTSTVSFTTEASHPQLGQPLEIWLSAPGVQANFDDVRLNRTDNLPPFQVPTLGSTGLLLLSILVVLAGVGWIRLRR